MFSLLVAVAVSAQLQGWRRVLVCLGAIVCPYFGPSQYEKHQIGSDAVACLVRLACPSYPVLVTAPSTPLDTGLLDEFRFVLDLLLAILLSHYSRTSDSEEALRMN